VHLSPHYCQYAVLQNRSRPQQERTCHRKKLAFEDGRLAALRVQKLHHLFTETLGKIFEVGTISLKTTAPMPAKTFHLFFITRICLHKPNLASLWPQLSGLPSRSSW
jgi:hypothetical protein